MSDENCHKSLKDGTRKRPETDTLENVEIVHEMMMQNCRLKDSDIAKGISDKTVFYILRIQVGSVHIGIGSNRQKIKICQESLYRFNHNKVDFV